VSERAWGASVRPSAAEPAGRGVNETRTSLRSLMIAGSEISMKLVGSTAGDDADPGVPSGVARTTSVISASILPRSGTRTSAVKGALPRAALPSGGGAASRRTTSPAELWTTSTVDSKSGNALAGRASSPCEMRGARMSEETSAPAAIASGTTRRRMGSPVGVFARNGGASAVVSILAPDFSRVKRARRADRSAHAQGTAVPVGVAGPLVCLRSPRHGGASLDELSRCPSGRSLNPC